MTIREVSGPGGASRPFGVELIRRLEEIYGGQRWIVAADVDQGAVRTARELRQLFDVDVLAVGARPGTGPVDPTVELVSLGLPPSATIAEGLRSARAGLAEPPEVPAAAIDRWDPDRRAAVLANPLVATGRSLLSRPVFAPRRAEWLALEDKIAIGPLLDAAGVSAGVTVVVDADDEAALLAAHRRLAGPRGTVWAGDNHSGVHGGTEGTHWVPDEAAAARQAARLDRYDRVRVMPFIDGLPCSIHGLVGAGGEVAAFRPCELMILRDPVGCRFVYARASTFWDPAPADRRAMVGAARRVGRELDRAVGYRGIFTLDGILGAGGFVATEVNPRQGAALPARPDSEDGSPIPLHLVDQAVVSGALDDLDVGGLEAWLVPILDRDREAGAAVLVDRRPDRQRVAHLVAGRDGGFRLVESEPGHADPPVPGALARFAWGPGPGGAMVRMDGVTGLETGPPSGPRVVEWLRAVDAHWSLGLPPLEAARPVR